MFRGRKFSSDDLQLLLLAQLEKGRSHGYQLIKSLSELSEGVYSPSPGMVYPALTYLEEIGYADVALDSNKKLYALSEAGKQYLGEHQGRADELLAMLGFMAKRAREMRDGEGEAGEEGSPLWEAMRSLRVVLRAAMSERGQNAEQIAAILKRAAGEIRDLTK
jgi:DNA-binding PadR family transcriptional regulator